MNDAICPWCREPLPGRAHGPCSACRVGHHDDCVAEFGPCAIAECTAHRRSRPSPGQKDPVRIWERFLAAHADALRRWDAFLLEHSGHGRLIRQRLFGDAVPRWVPLTDAPPTRLVALAPYPCCYAFEKQGSCSGHVGCCATFDRTGSCSGHPEANLREVPTRKRQAWDAWQAYDEQAAKALSSGLKAADREARAAGLKLRRQS